MSNELDDLIESLGAVRKAAFRLARTKDTSTKAGRMDVSTLMLIGNEALSTKEMLEEHWKEE